jgi:hypothetical protein
MSLLFNCPHCNGSIEVNEQEINCGIFRHAAFKTADCPPIPPHTPENECLKLVAEGKVQGCAKPFRVSKNNNTIVVEKCEYI